MPIPSPASTATTSRDGSTGPRIHDASKPVLPRSYSQVSWPTSAEGGSDDEKAEPPPAGKPKLGRALSNLSNLSSSGKQSWRAGPRIPKIAKPVMLRSLTGMSWNTDSSEPTKSKEGQEDHAAPDVGPSLKKCGSRISFSSWKSGSSGGSSSHRPKKPAGPCDKAIPEEGEPNDEPAVGERRINFSTHTIVTEPQALNEIKGGKPNMVRTAKYTMITWLPKSLFQQFQRVANIYFLCIVVLVLFPWTPKDPKSKVFPFLMVLLWTALKDLHEDSRRRRDDALENHQKTMVFDLVGDRVQGQKATSEKRFVDCCWQDVRVGDVILVESDQAFPADLLLLYCGGSYEAFISTISLDGETNLKERRPPSICDNFVGQGQSQADHMSSLMSSQKFDKAAQTELALRLMHEMHTQNFSCKIGKPEVAVQDIKGTLSSRNQSGPCPVAFNNFLPRGCVLRNTSWVLALVLFVGDETKTRLNTAQSKGKVSNMQKYLNQCVWGLLIGLMVVCTYAATLSVLQEDSFSFCCSKQSWLIRFGIFSITFYHVVPMSLYVVFEMLKLFLGYQVTTDEQMICPETGVPAVARTADLIEEMGQINFVFSDKTGTLTKNEMVFAKVCVNGKDLGDFRKKGSDRDAEGVAKVQHGISHPDTRDQPFWRDVHWFFVCVATCHSVQVEHFEMAAPTEASSQNRAMNSIKSKNTAGGLAPLTNSQDQSPSRGSKDTRRYMAMSPDEVALVEAAQQVGIIFERRARQAGRSGSSSSEVTLSFPDGESKNYQILHELEFNSDRKRMSVVMQQGDQIFLVTKGADSVMEPLLTEAFSSAYQDHLGKYSQSGLRTLVVAYKKVDKQYFKNWEKDYKAALSILDKSKDEKVDEVAARIEHDLLLLGITGVEDCLQDGVPNTIATIKEAGVKVWVLTGDKTETAVDIARSCNLFMDQTTLAYATEAGNAEVALAKLQAAQQSLKGIMDAGLVLDGRTLQHALPSEACRQLIFELGISSRSCVCCRLTPLQKRMLVDLVRGKDPFIITLAIGDGANDVPMIEGAHLGVAVRGKEGAQAVQVSDVAISQFRFLVPLLLCHGRRAYRRIALYLCYYLYKNVALAMGDFVWMHMDKYRGRIAFPEYLSINYNVFFTSWHILFVLGFDRDVPDEVANANPELYLVGPNRQLFNKMVFSRWMVFAVYHGVVAWIVPYYMIADGAVYEAKEPGKFWEGSLTAFTIIILIVLMKLIMNSQSPFKLTTSILPSIASLVLYLMGLGIIGYMPLFTGSLQPNMKEVPSDVFKNSQCMIAIGAITLGVSLTDLIYEVAWPMIWPTPLDRVKRSLRRGSFKLAKKEGPA